MDQGWSPAAMAGELAAQPDILCRGGSAIVSPFGEYLAGPLFDQEGTLYAQLDLAEAARGKFDLDVVGHYARPDVFRLLVNEHPTLTIPDEAKEQ